MKHLLLFIALGTTLALANPIPQFWTTHFPSPSGSDVDAGTTTCIPTDWGLPTESPSETRPTTVEQATPRPTSSTTDYEYTRTTFTESDTSRGVTSTYPTETRTTLDPTISTYSSRSTTAPSATTRDPEPSSTIAPDPSSIEVDPGTTTCITFTFPGDPSSTTETTIIATVPPTLPTVTEPTNTATRTTYTESGTSRDIASEYPTITAPTIAPTLPPPHSESQTSESRSLTFDSATTRDASISSGYTRTLSFTTPANPPTFSNSVPSYTRSISFTTITDVRTRTRLISLALSPSADDAWDHWYANTA